MGKGIACRSYRKGKSRRAVIQGSQSNFRCAASQLGVGAICSHSLVWLQ